MGSLNSILSDAADITEQNTESSVQETNTTPCALRHRRLLDLDPRSPSEAISRTPIILEKDKKDNVPPSTESLSCMIDPRSPTNQFLRTPIQPSLQGTFSPSRAYETAGKKTDTYQSSESGIDSREASPDPVQTNLRNALFTESPDSAVSSNGSCHLASSLPDLTSALSLTPVRKQSSVETKPQLSVKNFEEGAEKKEVLNSQETNSYNTSSVRQRIPVDKRLEVLSEKNVLPRSPLAALNNSPRSTFVKPSTVRPPAHRLFYVDKENDI